LFTATLNQMAFLFTLIVIGYLLMKKGIVPDGTQSILSKLENWVFIPALVLSTFIENFTISKLSSALPLLGGSLLLELIVIPLSLLCVRFLSKDPYIRNIYLYGLCFSNFGFVGNAVVSSLFADVFLEYIIFTLVLWVLIYLWGVPSLLMGGVRQTVKQTLKNFVNPMFIAMLVGIILGLTALPMPSFVTSLVSSAAGCMSPVAMLLTGMTIAKMDLKAVLRIKSIYAVSALRLLVFPLLFIACLPLLGSHLSRTFIICAVCSLAMPLGLNTIVIPSAYGKDTSVASGMALVSHTLSILTIPLVFFLLERFL